LDVSHAQSKINWTRVATAKRSLVIIKATDGTTFADPQFTANRAGARSIGMPEGHYHFFRATKDAKTQAEFFLRTTRPWQADEIIPSLDCEVPDDDPHEWEGIPVADRTGLIEAWLEVVEQELGRPPMIYMDQSFLADVLGGNAGTLGRCPLWLAAPGATKPRIPAAWKVASVVQTSFTGTVAGVPGRAVDLDMIPSQAVLQSLLIGTGAVA